MRPSLPTLILTLVLALSGASPRADSVPGSPAGRATAPDFALRALDGSLFKLSGHTGKGPIILNFWATWCVPCLAEMKALQAMLEARKGPRPLVLSVSVDDPKTAARVKSLVRSRGYPFTFLLDGDKEAYRRFQATGVPELFLLDKAGRIAYSHSGFNPGDEKALAAELDALEAPAE